MGCAAWFERAGARLIRGCEKGCRRDAGSVLEVHKAGNEDGHDASSRPGFQKSRREARQKRASHARGERIRLERAKAATRTTPQGSAVCGHRAGTRDVGVLRMDADGKVNGQDAHRGAAQRARPVHHGPSIFRDSQRVVGFVRGHGPTTDSSLKVPVKVSIKVPTGDGSTTTTSLRSSTRCRHAAEPTTRRLLFLRRGRAPGASRAGRGGQTAPRNVLKR